MPIVSVDGRDDAGRVTTRQAQIDLLDLQWRAVTGSLPASARVQTEDGREVPALRWLADEGSIAVEPDRDALRYMRDHTARRITRRAAFDILDHTDDPMAREESIDLTDAQRVISVPDWAAHETFRPAEIGWEAARQPIAPAAWAAWLEPPVVRRINAPPWGLGFALPEDAAIVIPPWVDPTEGAMPALPDVAVRWRPAEGAQPPTTPDEQPVWQEAQADAFVAPLGGMGGVMDTAQADGGVSVPTPRPVELAARFPPRQQSKQKRTRGRPKAPPPRTVRVDTGAAAKGRQDAEDVLERARARRRARLEAIRQVTDVAEAPAPVELAPTDGVASDAEVIRLTPRADVDMRGAAMKTDSSLGAWGCLGKLIVLQALGFAALIALNLGVQMVVEVLGGHVATVEAPAAGADVAATLPAKVAPLGGGADEPNARLVFVFDPADPAGWRAASAIASLQDHRAEGTGWRLLLQPDDAAGARLAFEVHELLAAGLPAAALLDAMQAPSGAGGLRGRLDALRRDPAVASARLQREDTAHSEAIARRVVEDAATGAALGIHEGTSGLLLSGVLIPPEDAGPAVLLERLRVEALDVAAALEVAPDDNARLEARLAGPTAPRRVPWNDLIIKGLPPAVEDGRIDNVLRMVLGEAAASRPIRLRVPGRAPQQGASEAPVQLIAVHDYRDPASRALAEDIERLRLAWGETLVVRWMFTGAEDTPELHALVALAAARQGYFDAAHAMLLESQGQASAQSVGAWVDDLAARDSGFDGKRLSRDLRRAPKRLERMQQRLRKAGIAAAPAVVIGRALLEGVPDYAALDAAVQAEAARRAGPDEP